ncbi:hypothetical protein [Actinacidiphila sp. ITFR-21]|uniref:hypothetical protein n=1 Tax=Actinacidiphila sp. ITFR-21 TaxID=3075199 RepID=UPI00288A1C9D|nr:hypothetical protein [Streptomyces sp. ITFR-21]WNI17064.1 hypothetical protein RLT57_17090 [Streptomyces sp. ITFR-21]
MVLDVEELIDGAVVRHCHQGKKYLSRPAACGRRPFLPLADQGGVRGNRIAPISTDLVDPVCGLLSTPAKGMPPRFPGAEAEAGAHLGCNISRGEAAGQHLVTQRVAFGFTAGLRSLSHGVLRGCARCLLFHQPY